MKYQEMSDFEIDCEVVSLVYDDFKIEKETQTITIKKEVCKGIVMERPCYPTSSWADSGPIIQENGMTTIKLQNGMWVVISQFIDEKSRRFSYTDKNILRAAMIVFLMMKGGE